MPLEPRASYDAIVIGIARYGPLRDASLGESFEECTSIGRDLSQLAAGG